MLTSLIPASRTGMQSAQSLKTHISRVSLRSDEAGCYHNNSLMAAVRDIGERVGITVTQYDFSPTIRERCL